MCQQVKNDHSKIDDMAQQQQLLEQFTDIVPELAELSPSRWHDQPTNREFLQWIFDPEEQLKTLNLEDKVALKRGGF